MLQEIVFSETDRIAVIAPHPDDECIGAAAALLKAPEKTDIYVLTDGSHGSRKRTVEEERVVRKKQFEAEMEYLKPHAWYWFGFEDTKLKEQQASALNIDFTKYTKIFLPELDSQHPDHTAAAQICCDLIRRQGADAECYLYEVSILFHYPSHYIDITGMEEEKRRLLSFHEDQSNQGQIAISLNAFRAAQMIDHDYKYVECYESIDVYTRPDTPDFLFKLYAIKDDPEVFARLERSGIEIKRVMPMDITKVYGFIRDNFTLQWADECLPAIISGGCYVAVRGHEILGFTTVETPAKGFVGPFGVLPEGRRTGIGRALTLTALKDMRAKGYKYAAAGMAHPRSVTMAKSIADIVLIPDSLGTYHDRI